MSLDYYRALLVQWLQTSDCLEGAQNYGYTMSLIKDWWTAYKEWESQDLFIGAFEQERLSVTQRPWVQKNLPGKDTDLLATSQSDPKGDKISHGRSLNIVLT